MLQMDELSVKVNASKQIILRLLNKKEYLRRKSNLKLSHACTEVIFCLSSSCLSVLGFCWYYGGNYDGINLRISLMFLF